MKSSLYNKAVNDLAEEDEYTPKPFKQTKEEAKLFKLLKETTGKIKEIEASNKSKSMKDFMRKIVETDFENKTKQLTKDKRPIMWNRPSGERVP